MGNADGGDAEDGDANGGDDKADDRGPDITAGHLAEVDREDQVAGAEKHAEQRAGDKQLLLEGQFLYGHGTFSPSGNVRPIGAAFRLFFLSWD